MPNVNFLAYIVYEISAFTRTDKKRNGGHGLVNSAGDPGQE